VGHLVIRLSRDAAGTARNAFVAPPVGGWNTRDPIATLKPEFASIMDNYVVEGGLPRVRRGWRAWATGLPGRVDGLMNYAGAGAAQALFAASGTGIYNVTAGGAVGSAVVSGLTSARWDAVNFAASGGNFMLAWNGADTERTFDGATWATWGATGLTGRVIWGGSFKGRLIVGTANRLSFYYGGAGAIAGSFTEFPLQGVARRGGSVVAFATLTLDGAEGPDDIAVFITSEGEAIVYAGTDPSSVTTWGLIGRWLLPRPLGAPHRCVAAYGGDALLLTDMGAVPLSAFRNGQDAADVLDRAAITRNISTTWRSLANDRRASPGWGITPVTRYAQVVMNVPWGSGSAQQITMSGNGAVTRWGGIPAAVWAEGLGGRVFAGDAATGRVLLYGEDTSDAGSGIRSEILPAFATLRAPGSIKRVQMMQPILRDATAISYSLSGVSDWRVPVAQMDALGAGAAAPALPTGAGGNALIWDVGLWDVNVWGGEEADIALPWVGVTAMGYAIAPRLQMVSGSGRPSLLGLNMLANGGGTLR
jgi:hypothetical protein